MRPDEWEWISRRCCLNWLRNGRPQGAVGVIMIGYRSWCTNVVWVNDEAVDGLITTQAELLTLDLPEHVIEFLHEPEASNILKLVVITDTGALTGYMSANLGLQWCSKPERWKNQVPVAPEPLTARLVFTRISHQPWRKPLVRRNRKSGRAGSTTAAKPQASDSASDGQLADPC